MTTINKKTNTKLSMLLPLILLLMPSKTEAQEKENEADLVVTYQCIYQGFSNDRRTRFNFFDLTIDKNKSSFCNRKAPEEMRHESKPQRYRVYKNLPKEGAIVFWENYTIQEYYYEEEMPQFDWQVIDGDTVICDYLCHKAMTSYRGRTWYVWYTLDLPYSDGPWKLCGLPGLILQAVDKHGDFFFKAIGISKPNGQTVNYKKSGSKVKPREMADITTLYYKDIMKYLEKYTSGGCKVTIEGMRIPSNDVYLMEYFDDEKDVENAAN